jgi:hypothetical protein
VTCSTSCPLAHACRFSRLCRGLCWGDLKGGRDHGDGGPGGVIQQPRDKTMARKGCCKTITQLFVTSGWKMTSGMNKDAFKEFTDNGWEEGRDSKTGFRCLTKDDADIGQVRLAAKKNPGMIFVCFTLGIEPKDTIVHLGIGGKWLSKRGPLSEEIGLRHVMLFRDYVQTMRPKRGGRVRRRSRDCAVPKKARTAKGRRTQKIMNRLVFHGRPDEVERCRVMAAQMLPAVCKKRVQYTTDGNEGYASGSMSIETQGEPALRIFNRLLAQVPAVTVLLEYEDPTTGKPRRLRAVDGKIDGGK